MGPRPGPLHEHGVRGPAPRRGRAGLRGGRHGRGSRRGGGGRAAARRRPRAHSGAQRRAAATETAASFHRSRPAGPLPRQRVPALCAAQGVRAPHGAAQQGPRRVHLQRHQHPPRGPRGSLRGHQAGGVWHDERAAGGAGRAAPQPRARVLRLSLPTQQRPSGRRALVRHHIWGARGRTPPPLTVTVSYPQLGAPDPGRRRPPDRDRRPAGPRHHLRAALPRPLDEAPKVRPEVLWQHLAVTISEALYQAQD
ncbi:hypothetical protein FOCC_FOCC008645 [Frankliniella occidentalis]|nr:hypothetical protein FOCC_FOCC008645 [Frankliniella occidentalis]